MVVSCRGLRGSLVTVLVVGLLACFTMVPTATAAGPDGSYKLVKATGSLSAGGEVLDLDQAMIKNLIGASKGKIVVSKSRIKLDRGAAVKMMEELGESYGMDVEASISGPKAMTLKKKGRLFVGKTSKPVTVNFKVNTGYNVMTGTIRSHFKVKVRGKTMVVNVPVTGDLMGKSLKGQVKATCKR